KAVSRRYRNRRIGEFLKELDLTEGRSTGIPKILKVMKENGSPAPEFESDDDRTHLLIRLPVHERAVQEQAQQVTPQVTPQVHKLLAGIRGDLTRAEIMEGLGLKDRMHFAKDYLQPALDSGLIEMTIPDKPQSSKQKYRLTAAGRALLEQQASSRDETGV
ncbi:MAG: transcriptional regulator, partial [Candidatus Thermoplasmatota archaeon]|nr:transcriptional regulator [Candidatus Thermoplasmatota archaeon]